MRKLFLLMAALASGCEVHNTSGNASADAEQARLQAERDQARREVGEIRFIVDKGDRELRVYRANDVLRRHDVSVGAPRWETPGGSWTLDRVDINPEWNPPDSDWARNERRRPPGDPENPMGQARLVFSMPYTIHGTDDLESLGEAASHGSIRVANENVIALAELLLRAGGAWEGRQWFENMVANRNTEFQVELPHPVPIEVRD